MKCYKLEEHNTRDCPKESNFKICSECNKEGHLWYEYKDKKNCINCHEEHSNLVMKCLKRKSILKEKKERRLREAENELLRHIKATN